MTVFTLSNEYSTIVIMFLFMIVAFFFIENRYILLEGGEGNLEQNCYHSYKRYLRNNNHTDKEIISLTADVFYPTIFTKCANRRFLSGQNKYNKNSYKNLNYIHKAMFQSQFRDKFDAFSAAVEHGKGKNTDQSCTTYRETLNKNKPTIAKRFSTVCDYLDRTLTR